MTEPTEELRVPCEVYSRIVGYLRPVADWHAGKQAEFRDRATFDMAKALAKEEDQEWLKARAEEMKEEEKEDEG